MEKFNLGISYTWEYDQDFIDLIENIFQSNGLSTYIIKEHNVSDATEALKTKALAFDCYLDRASDVNDDFEDMAKICTKRRTAVINPYKKVKHAIDKASMHLEFISNGINTPYSIIIPPVKEADHLYISLSDLAMLGRPFIIKPCNNTGGGIGVVTGAESLKEIIEERRTNSEDKYLIQEKIYPQLLNGKRAWFRCFWAFGKAIPVWWDDQTHEYQILTLEEVEKYKLRPLFNITKKISNIAGMDFFSTEIVLCRSGKFISVDYVNDQCDMRIKSKHFDGVPDPVVNDIILRLLQFVKKNRHY